MVYHTEEIIDSHAAILSLRAPSSGPHWYRQMVRLKQKSVIYKANQITNGMWSRIHLNKKRQKSQQSQHIIRQKQSCSATIS